MCQAPVGKVTKVGERVLVVEYNGRSRELRSMLPGIKVGDYVSFSLDIAIDRIDREEAEAVLGAMR
jgi:hydrogenase maturation factor